MPFAQFVDEVYLFNPRMVHRHILRQRGHIPVRQTVFIRPIRDMRYLNELR